MSDSAISSYPDYLEAKEAVDAAARNQDVWRQFIDALRGRGSSLSILEVGGGTGRTAAEVLDAMTDPGIGQIEYTLVDASEANVEAARARLHPYAASAGTREDDAECDGRDEGQPEISLRVVQRDLLAFSKQTTQRFDAVIAQSVLDLVPVVDVLPALSTRLEPNGLWYLPLHYDGITAFEPVLDRDLDAQIQSLYNRSMMDPSDPNRGSDGAWTGRRLLSRLRSVNATLLEAEPSDWILFAGEAGFSRAESAFLRAILGFVEAELRDHPELNSERFEWWLTERRRQLAEEELIFLTHQIDILAQGGKTSGSRVDNTQPSKSGASST